jgi:hypothetical protein
MRVIPASAGEGRSCMYTVQCTTEGMKSNSTTCKSPPNYSGREPANIGRNIYLPSLPTFTIHLYLCTVLYKVHHPTYWISFRCVPICTATAPFCDHTSVARCIPGMHLTRDTSSKGRIFQGTHHPRDASSKGWNVRGSIVTPPLLPLTPPLFCQLIVIHTQSHWGFSEYKYSQAIAFFSTSRTGDIRLYCIIFLHFSLFLVRLSF